MGFSSSLLLVSAFLKFCSQVNPSYLLLLILNLKSRSRLAIPSQEEISLIDVTSNYIHQVLRSLLR